ncbi:hypothetical protein [Pseudoxanthomonas winnipegensis]|uniref:Uncharacterized protein n=1 Tax=Pseudoxanthomonas winnipegensis TaxID=2480810 RepID=A0A4Q8LXE4_9GAMM|nr:hypothetical protein [Pseudoxanthomonas winnipegensis]RZZ90637.1 hypothetical protein EA663_02465 [Pseudoxanthomonas winnipegensis]TAA37208.1 hypothetical protein EA656_00575 [Pseudoxanthomonas winnipegensis]
MSAPTAVEMLERVVAKVRARAYTYAFNGKQPAKFVEGLRCAANMLEAEAFLISKRAGEARELTAAQQAKEAQTRG